MTDADNAAHDVPADLTPPGSGVRQGAGSAIPRQRDGDAASPPTVARPPMPDSGAASEVESDYQADVETDLKSDLETDPEITAETGVPDHDPEIAPRRRKRSKWKTAAAVVAALAVVCSGTAVALVFNLTNRYESKVAHEDILGDVPKPPTVAPNAPTAPMNFLILGSDSRAAAAAPLDDPDGSRSDTIMIVHVSADHQSAFIFSIPRDSYVNVPAGGPWRGGKNKINAAFAFGGAKLAAKTVYELTKIPLDGAMIVNFGGIHSMVAEVGTVQVCVPYSVRSIHTSRVWPAGCHDLGPDEAEDFMRQRKSVPGGDFGRIHDQQLVVKALADKIASSGMLTNPISLDQLIVTAASSVTLDKNMNLRDLALTLKGIKPDNITFATTPYSGTMNTSAGSSVQLDMVKAKTLFQAVIDDKTTEWLAANPQSLPTG
jgi:LCP family protein required for cell wall assembly